MAASDQHYRPQHALDIIFGVSCLVMLLTIVGMFTQDYFREFKVEQRQFRDIEAALAQRAVIDQVAVLEKKLSDLTTTEKAVADTRKAVEDAKRETGSAVQSRQ